MSNPPAGDVQAVRPSAPGIPDAAAAGTRFSKQIREALLDRYGLRAAEIGPAAAGTESENAWVRLEDGTEVFVKAYGPDARLDALRSAIDLAEFCRADALPVPRPWPDRAGVFLARHGDLAVTVWDRAQAGPSGQPMNRAQAESIGQLLARLHRRLAVYPRPPRPIATRWWTADPVTAAEGCERLLSVIQFCGGPDSEIHLAQLRSQRHMLLSHGRRLQGGLLPPGVGTLHGNFVRPNVMLLGNRVTGVVDFLGRTGPWAWELGRIALDPLTVATTDTWKKTALALTAAYLGENPPVDRADIVGSARMALTHALFSLFGITEAFIGPEVAHRQGLLGHWSQRHTMTERVLAHLDEIEDELRAIAHRR